MSYIYSTFFDKKIIHIKLLNGSLFEIEINEFDDSKTVSQKIIDKIINTLYLQEECFRLHRMKFFIENKENISHIYDLNILSLQDNDVICIICDSPPDPTDLSKIPESSLKEYDYSYFGLHNSSSSSSTKYNVFIIKDLESLYDAIDSIYFKNYDKDLPLIFDFDFDLRDDKDIFNNNYITFTDIITELNVEKIEKLIKIMPFQDNSYEIFIKNKNQIFNENLINLLYDHFKSISYISLKTFCLDIETHFSACNSLYNIINQKSSGIENLYMNMTHFNYDKYLKYDLENIKNIFIFSSCRGYHYYGNDYNLKGGVDYFLRKINSKNNTVYIKIRYDILDENNNLFRIPNITKSNWMYVDSDSNDINIYRHISSIEYDDFFSIGFDNKKYHIL